MTYFLQSLCLLHSLLCFIHHPKLPCPHHKVIYGDSLLLPSPKAKLSTRGILYSKIDLPSYRRHTHTFNCLCRLSIHHWKNLPSSSALFNFSFIISWVRASGGSSTNVGKGANGGGFARGCGIRARSLLKASSSDMACMKIKVCQPKTEEKKDLCFLL